MTHRSDDEDDESDTELGLNDRSDEEDGLEDKILFGPNATGYSGDNDSVDKECSNDRMSEDDERERLSLLDSDKEENSDIEVVPLNNGVQKDCHLLHDDVPVIEDYCSDEEYPDLVDDVSDDEGGDEPSRGVEDPLFQDEIEWECHHKRDVVVERVKPEDRIQPSSNGPIPNQYMENRTLSNLASGIMSHTPCGNDIGTDGRGTKQECWSNGRCKKHFPKAENDETDATIEGYPHYRRRVTITPESKYEMSSKKKLYTNTDDKSKYKYKITNKYHHFLHNILGMIYFMI